MRPLLKLRGGRRRNCGVAALAAAGLIAGSLTLAPAAFAESVTSPTGMLTVSVPPPVVAGAQSTYTMTVTNQTSSQMIGITAQSDLPSGMTLQGLSNCARLGPGSNTSFTCTMPNLAPGASETATMKILASGIGTYNIPLTVSGAVPVAGSPGTLQVTGDSVALAVNVQPGPTDIQVTGSSNNGSPPVGSTFNYTWQVKNNGPLPAFDVTSSDPLPSAILLGSNLTVDNGSCTANILANSVQCDIGSLPVGQQSNISLSATPRSTGVFGNTATVAMTGTDTQPANNSFTVTVQPK